MGICEFYDDAPHNNYFSPGLIFFITFIFSIRVIDWPAGDQMQSLVFTNKNHGERQICARWQQQFIFLFSQPKAWHTYLFYFYKSQIYNNDHDKICTN